MFQLRFMAKIIPFQFHGKLKSTPFLEINNWGRAVDTQIKRQDIEAFRAWKKELNLVMKATKGEGILNYVNGLTSSGSVIQARMGITENDATVDSLKEISKVCTHLCVTSRTHICYVQRERNGLYWVTGSNPTPVRF